MDRVRERVQEPRALRRRRAAPGALEGRARGVDRAVDVLLARHRHGRKRVARRRLAQLARLTGGRLDEPSVDEEPVLVSRGNGHDQHHTVPYDADRANARGRHANGNRERERGSRRRLARHAVARGRRQMCGAGPPSAVDALGWDGGRGCIAFRRLRQDLDEKRAGEPACPLARPEPGRSGNCLRGNEAGRRARNPRPGRDVASAGMLPATAIVVVVLSGREPMASVCLLGRTVTG